MEDSDNRAFGQLSSRLANQQADQQANLQTGLRTDQIKQFDQPTSAAVTELHQFVETCAPLFVLTGAGCSTDSGLSDYRDSNGQWKRQQPITAQLFTSNESARKRYWARSAVGWKSFSQASPNAIHRVLASLQETGLIKQLVTQNVDGLHSQAGHQDVIDLHGRLDQVICLGCHSKIKRTAFQQQLLSANPALEYLSASAAPDGDADLEQASFDWVDIPNCENCGGMMKPDVVFFGENVHREVVDDAMNALAASNGMLVIGSSLMVFSGFRFARAAAHQNKPLAALNRGVTRADHLTNLKLNLDCGATLQQLAQRMNVQSE